MARRAFVIALAAVAGLASPQALAQLPTVQIPTVPTVPLPPVLPPPPPPPVLPSPPPPPKVDVPAVPPAPSVPPAPLATQELAPAVPSNPVTGSQASGDATGSGTTSAASGGAGAGGGSTGSGRSPHSRSKQPRATVARFRASPPRFRTDPRAQRHTSTTFVFWLRASGVVRFTVHQDAPVCRDVGSWTVRGRAGRNRIRFDGTLGGTRLSPGTYTITATTGASKVRAVKKTRIVIVSMGTPLAAARAESACGSPGSLADARASGIAAGQVSAGAASTLETEADNAGGNGGAAVSGEAATKLTSAPTPAGQPQRQRGSSPASLIADRFDGPAWIEILLAAAAALSLLLLALAFAPRRLLNPIGAAATVAGRRAELALAATGILVCLAIGALLI